MGGFGRPLFCHSAFVGSPVSVTDLALSVGALDFGTAYHAALRRAARIRLRKAKRENVPVDLPFYDTDRMGDDHLAVLGPVQFAVRR
jgi:hypothetical protein